MQGWPSVRWRGSCQAAIQELMSRQASARRASRSGIGSRIRTAAACPPEPSQRLGRRSTPIVWCARPVANLVRADGAPDARGSPTTEPSSGRSPIVWWLERTFASTAYGLAPSSLRRLPAGPRARRPRRLRARCCATPRRTFEGDGTSGLSSPVRRPSSLPGAFTGLTTFGALAKLTSHPVERIFRPGGAAAAAWLSDVRPSGA